MSSQTDQITVSCPKCQHKFSIDDALVPQIAEAKAELRQKMLDWQAQQEEKLRKELGAQNEQELKLLQEQNEKQAKELADVQEKELQLRREKNQLDEDKKTFELKMQRQLDEERVKIREGIVKVMIEEHQLKDAEKDKKMADMAKMIEELKLKAGQGSQQLQGEVLEIELEELLKKTFPLDEIKPVAKGISGADVLQKVHDKNGRFCGSIVWESKRTKNWTEGWVAKLKEDMRLAKGDAAVLVSVVLPPEIDKFGPKDGIYITNFDSLLSVAALLRIALTQQAITKLSVVGKNEKMEAIYNYLSGNEFRQKVEAIVESFSIMREDLEKEKRAYTKIWANREKQIQRVLGNTIGMHGDLQGLMGSSLPEIESLALGSSETVVEMEILEDITEE